MLQMRKNLSVPTPNNATLSMSNSLCVVRLQSFTSYRYVSVHADCSYWDGTQAKWRTDGVRFVRETADYFLCYTTHLTDFGVVEFSRDVSGGGGGGGSSGSNDDDDSSTSSAVIIIVSVIGGVVVLSAIVVVGVLLKRKKSKNALLDDGDSGMELQMNAFYSRS